MRHCCAGRTAYPRRRYMLNVMKKIIVFILLVVLIGCTEKSVDPISNSPNEINGQFINWNPANGDSVLWRVSIDSVEHLLAHTKILSNGSFKINLPNPPSEVLHNYLKVEREDSIYFEMKDSIQFSDTTAKFISLTLEHYERISFPIQCGSTNGFDINSIVGDYQIHYYFFDRSTEVNGKWTVLLKDQMYPQYERTIITQYNKVVFKQGWNQIILKLVSLDDGIRTFEVLNENKITTEWVLVALPNEFVRLL